MNVEKNIFQLSRKISRNIGKAVSDYNMIRHGDKILIGLSGGKDSGLLAYALRRLSRRTPVRFEITAVSVDPTDAGVDYSSLEKFANDLDIGLEVVRYPIFSILDNAKNSSPCSLCANIRRGILASAANRLNCNVLALGHHRDDAVETVFLNMMYAGRFSCFHPSMYMSRSGIRVIRPMVYVPEAEIEREAARLDIPRLDFDCAHSASSKRADVKLKLKELSEIARDLDSNVIHALKSSKDAGAWGCAPTEPRQEEADNDFY